MYNHQRWLYWFKHFQFTLQIQTFSIHFTNSNIFNSLYWFEHFLFTYTNSNIFNSLYWFKHLKFTTDSNIFNSLYSFKHFLFTLLIQTFSFHLNDANIFNSLKWFQHFHFSLNQRKRSRSQNLHQGKRKNPGKRKRPLLQRKLKQQKKVQVESTCSRYWEVPILFFIIIYYCSTFVGSAWSFVFFSSPPQRPMTSDFEGILYPRFYPLHLFSYLNSWERASIFPFECSVLNKGTTGTIFIPSLVWRCAWLGIEPGTSCTRSQHYTTRLSRRYNGQWPPTLKDITETALVYNVYM